MKASVGDKIVVVPSRMDQATRGGRILEVRGPDGAPPYLVEWSNNGHQGLVFPGPDAHIEHFGSIEEPTATQDRVRTWHIDLHMFQVDDETTAHAVLVGDVPPLETVGSARRGPHQVDVPVIGDEVAAARALRRLADRMLDAAANDVAELDGYPVSIHP